MSMCAIVSWVIVVATFINCSSSQTCTNPHGNPGECRKIEDCDMLYTLLRRHRKTGKEWDFLKKSTCGFYNRNPKVCCPLAKCSTPDGVMGNCVDLKDCLSIVSKLERLDFPVMKPTRKDSSFLKKYKCGVEGHVCCPPPPPPPEPSRSEISQEENTMCTATARPPKPRSGCCGDPGLSDKIFGGAQAGIDDYAWLAMIERHKRGKYDAVCGGSLISGLYVLTAVHCVNGRPKLNVRLGEYDTSSLGVDCVESDGGGIDCTNGSVTIPVKRIIKHPSASIGAFNDIALLRLTQLVTFSEFIKPICLPSSDVTINPPVGLEFVVAGWGLVDNDFYSSVKMHVKVPYVSLSSCILKYSSHRHSPKLWGGQMCAGVIGRDSCNGDSGGPLMHYTGSRYELVGIVSYGDKPCGGPYPGIYTNVMRYQNWIEDNTRE